jgi:hypothetical protein
MFRIIKDRVDAGFLDDLTGVHNANAVGDLGDDAKVVSDKQNGQFPRFSKLI